MRILTLNTAFGFSGMDHFLTNVRHHLHIHGLGILTYELFPLLREKLPLVAQEKRIAYAKKHQDIGHYLKTVRQINPDILVLNEVLYELYKDTVEKELSMLPFSSIAWGMGSHYPGTMISLCVATKETGEAVPCAMPQRPSMGGGAGMAGLRLKNKPLTIFGVHLTYRNMEVQKRQLAYIREMVEKEHALGREVVLAGDWNENEAGLYRNPDFKALGLVSADPNEKLTCPVFLPPFLKKALDHIFVPAHWNRVHTSTIRTGSDHLALCTEVNP